MQDSMKLSDYLIGIGRPVAYFPGLRKITGSTNATIFFCQFFYWTGKETGKDGWIYKTSDEIEEETGLSYDEQKTAREKLKQAGLIEERYARLEHQMYFRVMLDMLNEKWGNREGGIPETGITALGKAESRHSLNESETTPETTTKEEEIFSSLVEKDEELTSEEQTTAGVKKGDLLDGILHYEKNNPAYKYQEVRDEFERAFGFVNGLPWDSGNTSHRAAYGRLERFLFAEKQKDPEAIQRAATYRKGEGKFGAMPANHRIYSDPDSLIACWPQLSSPVKEMTVEERGESFYG